MAAAEDEDGCGDAADDAAAENGAEGDELDEAAVEATEDAGAGAGAAANLGAGGAEISSTTAAAPVKMDLDGSSFGLADGGLTKAAAAMDASLGDVTVDGGAVESDMVDATGLVGGLMEEAFAPWLVVDRVGLVPKG